MSLVDNYLLNRLINKLEKYEQGIIEIIIEICFISEHGVDIEDYLFIKNNMKLNYIDHKIFLKEFDLYFKIEWGYGTTFNKIEIIKAYFGLDNYTNINIIYEKFRINKDNNNILSSNSRLLLYFWFDVDLYIYS